MMSTKKSFTRTIDGREYAVDLGVDNINDRRYMDWVSRRANDYLDNLERAFRKVNDTILERYYWWTPQTTRQEEWTRQRTFQHRLKNYA